MLKTKLNKMETADFYSKFPSEAEMLDRINKLQDAIRGHEEAAECRMMNYYNCVDDYSYGGICDQATSRLINDNRQLRSRIKDQLESKNTLITEETIDRLIDIKTGDVVSDRIVNGKFGLCWIIGDGDSVQFVGVAKRQKTYESKGFSVSRVTYTMESYINAFGGIVARVIRTDIEPYDFSSSLITYKSNTLKIALSNL